MDMSIQRGLKSKSFTVFKPPLTQIESIALESLKQIAMEGRRATQAELCAATGVTYQQGTLPAILGRLETKGYITRKRFQRGFQVWISGTDLATKEPENTAPHWRDRTEGCPAPAIHQIRQRAMPLAQMIETKARALGKPLHEFLIDCVYVGFHQIMHDGAEA
jgi:hypothetical protein